ncbi:MAG TPA: acyl-CoA thioesterase [Thermoplasmata archaeon]|nr:acyl-CoA thioesterase [Thermoplasmata archaeon]
MADPFRTDGPWALERRFSVTYHDLDVLRHLNHAAYLPMMETLRCAYYLDVIGRRDPTELDIIVAEASCRYLAPVTYGTELVGAIAPVRPLGRTSFTLAYRFRDAGTGRTTAVGRTVIVTYDYAAGAKREIPPERRRRLEADAIAPAATGWAASPDGSTRNAGVGVTPSSAGPPSG